ncbi:type IV pilus biogenesis/stability protein PilW [Pseudomonas aeruginosa]|nr:type IV pilus biogenesis/stability protein PilW [Pseudomonas aeruginosa]
MTVRAALVFLLAVGLTGCVTSGDQNPLKTDKGRDEARDAYIQLGLGYLQRGNTEQAKVPLRKALEIDPSSADAHARAGGGCSRPRWSPSWPTRSTARRSPAIAAMPGY